VSKKHDNVRVRADFNGLFGQILCISHREDCLTDNGERLLLRPGLHLTAWDEDVDENGLRDDLIASGVVERAPYALRCIGSRWVLRIDENGVRHESELRPNQDH